MERNGTRYSAVKNRRKTRGKGQSCLDDDTNITEQNIFSGNSILLKQSSLSYLIVSVLVTCLNVLYNVCTPTSLLVTEENRNITGLSSVDASFILELDKANEFFYQGQIKESLEKFSEILTSHPHDPRVLWGYAQALDLTGGQTNDKHFITDAKVALFDAISLPDVPRDIFIKALARLTQLYISTEPTTSLEKLWKFLSTRYKHSLEPRRLFIKQLLRHKQTMKRAENTLIEMIDRHPKDCLSIAILGQFYNNRNRSLEKAAHFLQRAVDQDCDGVRTRKILADLHQLYIRLRQPEKAVYIGKLGAERGLFLSPDQRSKSNADTQLSGRPWWTYEQSGYRKTLEFLESHWTEIRDEGMALLNQGPGPFQQDTENLKDEGIWQKMVLFRNGHRLDKNCKMAPITCGLLDKIPDATTLTRGQTKFSVLDPGTHLWAHSGPTNCRIRAHLGLKIPDGPIIRVANETRKWIEGKFIIFDDSFEHEVWHEGKDESRLVLIVDFWHPDITIEQRKRIRRFN